MLDEIRQQPAVIERTLAYEVAHATTLRRYFDGNAPRMILMAARGTSDNAAQFGRYLIEITTGIPVSLAAPSVFTLYDAPMRLEGVLVVGISQSGESTDTNFVLERARQLGAMTLGITNEADSLMATTADECFLVQAGKEQSVAATKTYTGQMLAFYLLAHALGAAIPADALKRIADQVDVALGLEDEVRAQAQRFAYIDHAVVIGRGLNYSNAMEFALKLMETCYVVAERFSSADLLHGPIAMMGERFPTFVFAPSGVTWTPIRELLGRLQSIRANTLIITDEANEQVSGNLIRLPMHLLELFTPIPYVAPAQLFAAALAEAKGLDPDRPRALEKVTRTF
jgi:glucosamine--fructose-6-phosphate aminotransferase (isomerizing)